MRVQAPGVPTRDQGAAAVDFLLVSTLVLGLFLGLVQLGFALYVRNTLAACVSDGARYAANADRSPVDGEERTRALIRRSLPDRFARDVRAGVEPGSDTVFVEVSSDMPLLGPWGVPRRLVLRGHAVEEATGG